MGSVDYQTVAGVDDGYLDAISFANDSNTIRIGSSSISAYKSYARWPNVIIPVGAIVTFAYCSFYHDSYNGTPPVCSLHFEDSANPTAPTSRADGASRILTSNSIAVTPPTSGTWWNTGNIASVIQELISSYSYASGAAMQMILVGSGSGLNFEAIRSYEYSSGGHVWGPKLHIEYTTGCPRQTMYFKMMG